jgi:hypothetical protein
MLVGLVAGHSLQAQKAAIAEISPFLNTAATVAVLIDSRESGFNLIIRERLERAGFRIQAPAELRTVRPPAKVLRHRRACVRKLPDMDHPAARLAGYLIFPLQSIQRGKIALAVLVCPNAGISD